MTEKRFDFKDDYITLDGGVFATAKNRQDAELISRTLNQLYEESEELKHQVNYLEDRLDELIVLKNENNDLKKENKELKQFKQKVINLINATIEELKKTNEVSLFPRESIVVLERLKKVMEND